MKNSKLSFALLAIFAMVFSSCSKDNETELNPDGEKVALTFGAIVNDLVEARSGTKDHLSDIPQCSDDVAAYVEVVVSLDGANVAGTMNDPLRVDLVAGQIFTEEVPELELNPNMYTLDYFTVHNSNGDVIWIAPQTNSNLGEYTQNSLPMNIDLGAGVKKYVDVSVLCFDNRDVNEYGYLFFEIDANRAIEFCVFGNYCDDTGRHYPAQYTVDVWNYSNGTIGNQLYDGVSSSVSMNNEGDYAASPVCFALPDTEGMDEYYFEITLRNSEAYGNVEERIIRAGVINDAEVRDLMEGDNDLEYYHFREGNCGDLVDSPQLLESEDSEFFDFIDDYANAFFNIEPFPALTPKFENITIDDAYAFQRRLNEELQERGVGEPTGYKLGFTGDQRPFGAPKPVYGRIYSSFEVPNGATLSLSEDFIRGSVGFEVAIILGEDINTAVSPEEARDAVRAIAPAFEFADFGFTPNNMVIDFRDIIATNSAARTYLLGEETLLEDLEDQGIDPNQIDLLGTLDGNVILDAKVGLPVDGIFKAVSFLSAELASRGESLEAGDIILTGAIKGDQNEGLGTYVGDYGVLGTIQFTLVE